MRILCPMCGFGREMDDSKVPPRAQMATCPRCQHKFRFRVVDDLEPAEPAAFVPPAPGEPLRPGAGQDLSAGTPPPQSDPMAAQRAAAEAAWKRIQSAPKSGAPKSGAPNADKPTTGQPTAGQPPAESAQTGPDGSAPTTTVRQPDSRELPGAAWTAPGQQQGTGSPVPFEDLPRFGFFPGIWGTIRQVLTGPAAFFRAMPLAGGMAKPLVFHLLLAEFMILCQYFWGLTGIGAMSQYTGSAELMDMGMGMAGASPVLLFVFYPLLLVLRLMVMTAVVHLLLRLLRAGGGGSEATFRVLCYASASLIAGVVPFIGPVIGGAWSIGLTILGLKEAHRANLSSAAFAVLVPIMLLLAAVLGLLQGYMKGV